MATIVSPGKTAYASIGGTELQLISGSVSHKQELIPVFATTSNGRQEYIRGKESFSFSLEVYFNGNVTIPQAAASDEIILRVKNDGGSQLKQVTFQGVYETNDLNVAADGVITLSISGQATGTITWADTW